MWQLNFKIYDKENKLREIIEKNKVKVYYYPTNYYTENKKYFFITIGTIKGNKINIKNFFNDIKKLKETIKGRKVKLLETENKFFVLITSHCISEEMKKYVHVFYNPKIIHLKPVIFHPSGWEEWEVISLKKQELNTIIEIGKKLYNLNILRFYWKKVNNFGFVTILPPLTKKQNLAIDLALKEGYYNYPRKTSLDKLSKIANVSFSTFQAHVRKAENKLIPFLLNLKK